MLFYSHRFFVLRYLPRWVWLMVLWGVLASAGVRVLPAQAQGGASAPVALTPAAQPDAQFGDSLIQSVQLDAVPQQGLYLSAQSVIILPAPVKDALMQGIPVYFEAQARITRERLWVLSTEAARQQRFWRLSFQPLTRKWRLQISGDSPEAMESDRATGLAQTYDALEHALASLQRIVGWQVVEADVLKPGVSYVLQFTLALDRTRLPRLFVASDVGRSVWDWRLRWQQEFALPPAEPGR